MKFAINLDFEAEDYICIGGAGGLVINSEARLKTESHAPGEPFSIWKLQARGVQGGHSGNDIDARPQNLHQHLFSIIKQLNACLLEYQGGEAINSIPSHADLILAFPRSEDERARDALARDADSFSALYAHAGGLPALEFEPLTESDSGKQFECLAQPMTSLLADAVSSLPNGVISRHARLGGNPCTSSSIGTVQLSPGGHLQVGIVVRSDNESEMTAIGNSIFETLRKIPAVSFKTDKYPAWQPDENAPIVRHCQRQRKNLFSKEATLISVHAGLECGLLAAKYPRLQFVSIGPNIEDVHATRERVSIESMHRVYAWLKAIISDIGDIH
jgi:dipeptidase D